MAAAATAALVVVTAKHLGGVTLKGRADPSAFSKAKYEGVVAFHLS